MDLRLAHECTFMWYIWRTDNALLVRCGDRWLEVGDIIVHNTHFNTVTVQFSSGVEWSELR